MNILLSIITISSYANNYPEVVHKALHKAGKNEGELEKVLEHYKNDAQKLEAACFLIANMDCHNSQSYYWANEKHEKVPFNEFDYPDYEKAIAAFNSLSSKEKLHPEKTYTPDIQTVSSAYLIANIDDAFTYWKKRSPQLSFELFCEYLLPYRVMNEPYTEWRTSFKETFAVELDKCNNQKVRDVCTTLTRNLRDWFTDIYDENVKKEPQDALSPQQILFRRQGYCEDMSNWGVYLLRSAGIASCIDYTPLWATSTGGHYWQAAFDESGNTIPFFMGDDTPAEFYMRREPSKVLRITYSKQPDSPATSFPFSDIPDGFLRFKNIKDVTDQYWRTLSFTVPIAPTANKITYLSVLNGGKWRVAWWAENTDGKAVFSKMTCGVVYLPVSYNAGKITSSDSPYLLTTDGNIEYLKPNKDKLQTVKIVQKKSYLIFRPGKQYTLLYWDTIGEWKSLGTQTAGVSVNADSSFEFADAPTNALFRLIPEYSQNKERPFTIGPEGEMLWW